MEDTSSNSNAADGKSLGEFIESVVGDNSLRVEEDFGKGYVRLKNSEAELRQAAQDIRSTEDVVIELLRNARDAGSKNIYLAFRKIGSKRIITVIDDGCGIPVYMHERIFQPRVTSKLDSAKMDRWGMHGRGMALFSITENSESAHVLASSEDLGSAIEVITDTEHLSEKTDQSTFPRFEVNDGVHVMRGPKNVFRTVAEFALDHKGELDVYCGTETEIVAAMYERGMRNVSPSKRIFNRDLVDVPTADLLGMATDPKMLSELAGKIGLEISERSARRIMDRHILPPANILERIANESFSSTSSSSAHDGNSKGNASDMMTIATRPKITKDDIQCLVDKVEEITEEIGERYYLEFDSPKVSQRKDKLIIEIPFVD